MHLQSYKDEKQRGTWYWDLITPAFKERPRVMLGVAFPGMGIVGYSVSPIPPSCRSCDDDVADVSVKAQHREAVLSEEESGIFSLFLLWM